MEKIIKVGDLEIPVKSTAASLISYKANFHRDGIRDMLGLVKGLPEDLKKITVETLADSGFDMEVFFCFLWVFAKSANKEIPPMLEWLEGIDVPSIEFAFTAIPQMLDLLMATATSSVRPKN